VVPGTTGAVCLATLSSAALADTVPAAGVLEFLDGASLHGRLHSMNPGVV
jgi:hypothetical protein